MGICLDAGFDILDVYVMWDLMSNLHARIYDSSLHGCK